jgi:hypothetical protein
LTVIEMTDTIKVATHVCRILKVDDAHEPRESACKRAETNERALSDLSFESQLSDETEG